MKRSLLTIAIVAMTLTMVGCKAKKSHYRQVYEQARQREIAERNNSIDEPATTEEDVLVSKPAESVVSIRKERLNAVEGEDPGRLKMYSVVIGSFQNSTNAHSLKERMESEGFSPVLAENESGMLRVIAASFDTREEAIKSRDSIKARFAPLFQDAWLLERDR